MSIPNAEHNARRNSVIDMSEFEAAFTNGQIAPWLDDVMFEKIADLRDRIGDLTDVRDWKKTFLKYADGQLEELLRIQRSLEEVIAEIRMRKFPFEEEKKKIRQDMSGDERKLEALQREWVRLMAELNARRREATMRADIDEQTKNAPWRKRAKKHQFEGAYRLSSARKGILGDKPGLGKTLQAIMSIDMMRATGMARKVLIFCPKPVLDGFEREFGRYSPGQFVHVLNQTMKGLKSEILDLVEVMPDGVIITNYEVWRKDKTILEKLIQCQFDTVVLDEAHVLKNVSSSTFKGIKRLVHAENKCTNCGAFVANVSTCGVCGTISPKAFAFRSVQNIIPMTGTAILNKPQDLFALLHLVDDQGFPDENNFLWDFCTRITTEAGPRWIFRQGGEEALLKRLGMKYTARNRDSAGVEMPPQEVKHWHFELDPDKYPLQYEFTNLLKNQARIKFAEDKEVTTTETLAWYTRMRQAATWPRGIKIPQFKDGPDGVPVQYDTISPEIYESIIMDEGENIVRTALDAGNRIVVFSKFKEALKEMEARLLRSNVSCVRYDGDLNDAGRIEAQRDFDLTLTRPENAKFQVMLAQYDSAKVGLNLHGAQEVLMLDREWNPGMEEQAMQRVQRIGSEFDTIVHILHVEGTATDLMDALIEEKKAMRDGFDGEVDLQEALRKFLEGNK